MNDWLAEQSRRNRESCGQWTAFAGHRQRVTALLVEAALDCNAAHKHDRPSLCLLGAGNCNDLDLATLLRSYSQIHLFDCDAAALTSGIERQAQTGQPALVVHGGVDLLGLPQTPRPLAPAELIASVALHRPLQDLAAFDVVASLCLLSQLTEAGAALLTGDESNQLQLLQAIRRRHLELLVERSSPAAGGC